MSTNPLSKLASQGTNFTETIHHDTYAFINPTQWNLNGKAVFITGASKGVGLATAISFASAGASFIGLGARSDLSGTENEARAAAEAAGHPEPRILSLKLDVGDEDSVAAAAEQIRSVFGRLDILVNNAAALEPWEPVIKSNPSVWWQTWRTNVFGVYLTSRALLPLLLETEDGLKTVVHISSIGAHVIMPGASGYQTTKLALLRFSEFLTVENSEAGLLSYSVHPGSIPTELAKGLPEQYHHLLGDTTQLASDSIVFLSAQRRDWLAGRYVSSNWDMRQLLDKREAIVEKDLLKVRMDVGLE